MASSSDTIFSDRLEIAHLTASPDLSPSFSARMKLVKSAFEANPESVPA
jgi:hypothetical protein